MIEKLRKRFFRIALIAMSAAMILVTAAINVINWLDVRAELRETLAMLAENEGRPLEDRDPRFQNRSRHERNLIIESSFFSGTWSEQEGAVLRGPVREVTTSSEEAQALIASAAASGKEEGRIGDYLFRRAAGRTEEESRYTFLNGETRLSEVRHLIIFSAAACLGSVLLVMIAVSRFSRRAVEPILKNERQQKQFITDASHELKTPLTVISANMDVLSLDTPDNPWIRSTRKQVSQMRRLVDEMVYLSRLEEGGQPLEMKPVSLGPLIADTAEPFAAMAEFQGRQMEIRVPEELRIIGDEAALQRLVSTLCDNAVKYAAPEGTIRLEARADASKAELILENAVSEPLTPEQCERLFQRFYRADPSRSKEKQSGFGIGLAIAAAIAEKHGGTIRAEMTGPSTLAIICRLPLAS